MSDYVTLESIFFKIFLDSPPWGSVYNDIGKNRSRKIRKNRGTRFWER